MSEIQRLTITGGREIAVRKREGGAPTVLFLPGYASDMEGAKATAIDAFCAARGLACLRLDYSGTGASAGEFGEATLDHWVEEAAAALEQMTEGPIILVGSSLGGWVALQVIE